MTDELERDLRAANPLRSRRTDPLSARAEAELADILASAPVVAIESAPRKRSPLGWVLAGAAALVVATLITVSSLNTPTAVIAALPELDAVPIDATLSEVLAEMSANARALPGDTTLGQVIDSEAWYSEITVDEESTTFFVQPQLVHLEWRDDYTGFIETHAGEVRWGDPVSADGMAEPGELLSHYDFDEPGSFPPVFGEPPPDTAEGFREYIRAANPEYDDDTDTMLYFSSLRDIRGFWPLTGPQAAGALDFIATLPDVELLGEVTDRVGRTGVAIVTATETHREVLVFDRTTGQLLSEETLYLGGIPDFDMPPGVMGYTAWEAAG